MLNIFGFWQLITNPDEPWGGIIIGSVLLIVGIVGLVITRSKRRKQKINKNAR